MKLKDVASQYGFNPVELEVFVTGRSIVKLSGIMGNNIEEEDVPKVVEAFQQHLEEINERERRQQERERRQQDDYNNRVKNIILTTCSSVDGYRAVAQYGLVFGECLFKASFSNQLDAALEDFGKAFSFKEKEMSGTTALLERARDYATKKMIHNAVSRGANAVVGIDAESSSGGNVMHITLYGTAVKLERIEDAVEGKA